jgi:hypothetical protein
VVAKGKPLSPPDIRILQRCLPQLFGTTLQTIPAEVPYLHPPDSLIQSWRRRLQPLGGYRVGVCWQGSQGNVHMRDRSFDCSLLAPIARIKNVTLVNLQVGAKPVAEVPIHSVEGFDYDQGDFLALAAIIKNLDLVIACDTSVAHLSGALAMPTWVALRHASEWRYMLERETCAWYPTMRLFRQPKVGNWQPVFEQMRSDLELTMKSSNTVSQCEFPRDCAH